MNDLVSITRVLFRKRCALKDIGVRGENTTILTEAQLCGPKTKVGLRRWSICCNQVHPFRDLGCSALLEPTFSAGMLTHTVNDC